MSNAMAVAAVFFEMTWNLYSWDMRLPERYDLQSKKSVHDSPQKCCKGKVWNTLSFDACH